MKWFRFKNTKLLIFLVTYLVKSIYFTVRVARIAHPKYNPKVPSIYAFWHGDLLVPVLAVKGLLTLPVAGFVSTSRDGDLVEGFLKNLKYEVVRGSTSKRAVAGLIKLLDLAKKGYAIGLAPDGPRGPRHHISKGIIYLAAKSKLPIIPLGLHVSKRKVFKKSWDQFHIPHPFAKAIVYFGEPLTITEVSEQSDELLKSKLFEASDTAKAWYEGSLKFDKNIIKVRNLRFDSSHSNKLPAELE